MAIGPLRLPRQYQVGFKLLFELPATEQKRLVEVIGQIKTCRSVEDLKTQIAEVSKLPQDSVSDIVDFLLSIYQLLGDGEQTPGDIAVAIVDSDSARAGTDEKSRKRMVSALTSILDMERTALSTMSSARVAIADSSAMLLQSACRVQVRPVFVPVSAVEPVASVLLHNLTVTYHEGMEVKELVLSLDAEAARKLVGQLQHSLLQEDRLSEVLAATSIKPLDSD